MEKETREEIVALLNKWFDENVLMTVDSLGANGNQIDFLSSKREITYTPFNKVVFRGNGERNKDYAKLLDMCSSNRIMTTLTAKVYKGYRNLYALHRAAKKGEIVRYVRDSMILYID